MTLGMTADRLRIRCPRAAAPIEVARRHRGQPRGEAGRRVRGGARAPRPTACTSPARRLAAGAAAVVARTALRQRCRRASPFVKVANARRALALAAAKFYPRQPAVIAAVTGTSGKTSVAAFTRQIWAALGHEAASIGTIGVVTPKREVYGSLTTPDPVALHRTLDELAGEGVTHLAIEASSHGLDQHRLDGVRVAAGGFTNLSRDHLDYHPTLEAYLAAKLRLFEELVALTAAPR